MTAGPLIAEHVLSARARPGVDFEDRFESATDAEQRYWL